MSKFSIVRPRVALFDHTAKGLKRKTRNDLHKWLKSKDLSDHQNYKQSRNIYRQHLDAKKKQHFTEAIQDARGDPKKLYSITLGLMGKKADNPFPPSSSDTALADDFANFFIEKIEKIRRELVNHPPFSPTTKNAAMLSNFQPLDLDFVTKLIRRSKPTTSLLDPIPTKLIKQNSDIIAPAIAKIVNSSLDKGSFYTEWKTAVVTPLLKKRDLEPIKNNYRPVSNLSFISKIAEKGVIEQLNDHFSSNKLHSSHQSAYKANFSTETALCVLVNDLLWSFERSEVTILVALDLSAAFDTVDHNILLAVLKNNFGVTGTPLDWLSSYLRDRQLKVKINDSTSNSHTFNYSVPQGSCLGPVLFNAYASTIVECIPEGISLGGYADDHFIKGKFDPSNTETITTCVDTVQNTLLSINEWMSANRLKLNPTKTEVIAFGSAQMLNKSTVASIDVVGDRIALGDCIKYLGANLDSTLSFKEFISQKCKSAAINIRNIAYIRKFIDVHLAKQLASALVLSHLDYSNSVLCGLPASSIAPMQRIQNWAARMVLGRSKFDSATEALKELHWLPVAKRIDFKVACLVFKCLYRQAPSTLANSIHRRSYARSTRAASNSYNELNVPYTRKKTFASRSFSVYGPELWNSLPEHLRVIEDFKCFKKGLKTVLFRRGFDQRV